MKKLVKMFKKEIPPKRGDTFITKEVKLYTTTPPKRISEQQWNQEFRVSSLHNVKIVHM